MVQLKKNFDNVLPYDRQKYIEFLDHGFYSSIKWYGASFQLPSASEGENIGLIKFVEIYECLFKNVVSKLDNGSFWIVNHDDKDLKWFPSDGDNLTRLRSLFKKRHVSKAFKGALIFTKDDLLEFSKDLISYPYSATSKDGFLYKNLDISHSELQFIIKISGHLNIDFLSPDKELLREVVNENSSNIFVVKEYKSTSLV
jgi:hypothetical protein